MTARLGTAIVALASMVASGCSAAKQTQIIVGVASDIPTDRFDTVALTVDYVDPALRVVDVNWRVGSAKSEIELPARLALSAGSATRRLVEIAVAATTGGKTLVARRARLSFVDERVIFISMNLIARCIGVKCGEDKTCGEIGCEPVTKDSSQLANYDPTREKNAADAGATDGFPDGLPRVDVPQPPPPDGGDMLAPSDGDTGTDGPVPQSPCPVTAASTLVSQSDDKQVGIGTLPDGTPLVINAVSGNPRRIEVHQLQSGGTFALRGTAYDMGTAPTAWDAVVHADGRVQLVYAKGSRTVYQAVLSADGKTWSGESTAYTAPGAMDFVVVLAAASASDRLYIVAGGENSTLGDPLLGAAYQKTSADKTLSGYSMPNASLPSAVGPPSAVRISSDGSTAVVTARFGMDSSARAIRLSGGTYDIDTVSDPSTTFDGPIAVAVGAGTAYMAFFDDIGAQPDLFFQRWQASVNNVETYAVVPGHSKVDAHSVSIAVVGTDARIGFLEQSGTKQAFGVARFKGPTVSSWSASDTAQLAGRTRLHFRTPRLHAAYSVSPAGSTYDIYYHCVPAP